MCNVFIFKVYILMCFLILNVILFEVIEMVLWVSKCEDLNLDY